MARKILMKNSGEEGSKAPKKSFRLLDPLHNIRVDNKHTNKVKNQSKGDQRSKNYTNSSSTQEVCQVTSIRDNRPGIVARLMGITDLPLDLGTKIQTDVEHKLYQTKKQNEGGSVGHASHDTIFVRHHEQQKSYSGEHPQEVELQKLKKDFSTWKVSRCRDPSRVADVDSIQRYIHGSNEKSVKVDLATHVSSRRAGINKYTESTDSQQPVRKENKLMIIPKESTTSRNIYPRDYSEPTRIVILKPGPDQSGSEADDCPSSSASSGGKYNNMEDFLEEMRGRMKNEPPLRKHGTVFESTNRESRSGELLYGREFDPRRIANQVRGSIARDLLRSEPLRSYKSDISADDSSLSERLKKYTELEPYQNMPSYADRGSVAGDIREPVSGRFESCRHIVGDRVISSRNLSRSLSAPVKGESFAKVLLEDDHFLNVAHARRCHVGETTCEEDAKEPKRRAKFNLREKISNFRHSFSFGRGLFSRKPRQTVSDPHTYGDSTDDITGGPTVVRQPRDVHENFTEVPPSPVSAPSSSEYDDEFRGFSDELSRVAPSDLSFHGYEDVSEKKGLKFADRDKQAGARDEPDTADPSGQNKAHIHDFIVNKSDTTMSQRKPEAGRDEFESHGDGIRVDKGSSAGMTKFQQNVWGKRTAEPQNGRKLVDLVWDAVKEYIYPEKDMRRRDDEVDGVGEEVERLIIEEMVEEMFMEMVQQLNDLSFNHFHIMI